MYNKNAQYDKAKEAIDKAVEHPKLWMMRNVDVQRNYLPQSRFF